MRTRLRQKLRMLWLCLCMALALPAAIGAMGLWMLVLWVEWAAAVPRYDNVFDGQLRRASHDRPYTPNADIAAPMREATARLYSGGLLEKSIPQLAYKLAILPFTQDHAGSSDMAFYAARCLVHLQSTKTRWSQGEHHIYGAILTRRIARDIPRDKLVRFYLNELDFDHDAYGVAAAAQKFLRKRPANLTLGESLALLAMVRGYRLPPYKIMARRDQLLDRLVAQGAISMQTATEAKREIFAPPARNPPIEANDLMQSLL